MASISPPASESNSTDSSASHTNRKALRVVILYSAGHLGSAIITNRLMHMPEVEVVGLVKAQPIPFSLTATSKLKRHFKKVGWQFGWLLFWQRLIQGVGYGLTTLMPFLSRRIQPAWKLAKQNAVPILDTANINSQESLAFLKERNADLFISAYFSQILKRDVIQLPKIGILNVHPGWLPSYQGAMAYFWVLKNQHDKGGVTVHWIDEGIDTGDILARRAFTLKPNTTQDKVLILTAIIGASLLRRVLRRVQKGQEPALHKVSENEKSEYFPMPGSTEFKAYFDNRRFFKIRTILGFMLRKRF